MAAAAAAYSSSRWWLRSSSSWRRQIKPSTVHRAFSSQSNGTNTTQFSYLLPQQSVKSHNALFQRLKGRDMLANHQDHNAAVVLVTPDFAKSLIDDDFLTATAQLLAGPSQGDEFHMVAAVVDHVVPPLGAHAPVSGISVLRGHLEQILPEFWSPPVPPRTKEDADAVAALTFELGFPSVTLPLTRTTFLNSNPSTLVSTVFDASGPALEMASHTNRHSTRVVIPLPGPVEHIGDLGLYVPLAPVTRPRVVTGSFGNIVKAVEVDGQSIPASTELEAAVNAAYQKGIASASPHAPMGIWALVAPPGSSYAQGGAESPLHLALDEGADILKLSESTAQQLGDLYRQGGRLYKILSGGGGWGAKKGLLSLDPQQTHFSVSEEAEMEQFMRTMENDSGFAPPGSTIQFLTSVATPPGLNSSVMPSISFGVPSDGPPINQTNSEGDELFIPHHFGALSNQGIFISGPESAEIAASPRGDSVETKLTVPHSRVYLPRVSE